MPTGHAACAEGWQDDWDLAGLELVAVAVVVACTVGCSGGLCMGKAGWVLAVRGGSRALATYVSSIWCVEAEPYR